MLVRITEYINVNPVTERWSCHRCDHDLGAAAESYKCGCLVHARHPHEVHFPIGPADFNGMLKAFRGDEPQFRAAALDQRIGSDGR